MKKLLSILLCMALFFSFSACAGGGAPQSPAVPQAQPTPQPLPLEPALQEALELGLAPRALLEQPDKAIDELDAVRLIQAVDNHEYGPNHSKYLADMIGGLALQDKPATRFWLAQLMYYSYCEEAYAEPYSGWEQWSEFCNRQGIDYAVEPDAIAAGKRLKDSNAGKGGTFGEGGLWELCVDLDYIVGEDSLVASGKLNPDDYRHTWGNPNGPEFCVAAFDRTTGVKLLPLYEDGTFRPQETLTVRDAVEAALRYLRSFPEKPDKKAYDEVGGYDRAIITAELLAKPSTLPDCSSSYLPAEWRGTLVPCMMYATRRALDRETDKLLTRQDIQLLARAGFNQIGLGVGFTSFQKPFFEKGMVNESHLRYLDQVFAWCIEEDIHIDLRCFGTPGFSNDYTVNSFEEVQLSANQMLTDPALRDDFAAFWGMLARRYADIPNRYLDFNLMCEPEISSDALYVDTYRPAVEAIRAESPERCIIADIHDGGLTGEGMAGLGVALSYHMYSPRAFCSLNESDPPLYEQPKLLRAARWPYTDPAGKTWDAEAALNAPMFPYGGASVLEVKAVAERYNVGFMVGEFGIFGTPPGEFLTEAYPPETVEAYYTDVVATLRRHGIGWSSGGNFHGEYGIITSWPAMTAYHYTKLENSPHWANDDIIAFWQALNQKTNK